MTARLGRWWQRAISRAEADEHAAVSAITVIIALPVLVFAFGYAVDVGRNVYLREEIQRSLDTATQAAAGNTVLVGNQVEINHSGQLPWSIVETVYGEDRPGAFTCQSNTGLGGGSVCWKPVSGSLGRDADGVPNTLITYTVQETTNNPFSSFVWQPTQSFTVTSTAQVRLANN